MDEEFIESLRGLSEEQIEKKLRKLGWRPFSFRFQMADEPITRNVLPIGSQTHREVLVLDYSVIKPEEYDPHQCYELFLRD
jgi:hypothetical protein